MSEDIKKFEEFLKFILSGILNNPDEADLKGKIDDRGVFFELLLPEEEMGRFIGKGGKTVKSVRVLLRAMGAKTDQQVNLKILEPSQDG